MVKTNPLHGGPWMSPEVVERLPNVARDFQLSRDPHIAQQTRELEGRGDQSGRGSASSGEVPPRPELKPPPAMRQSLASPTTGGPWLAEQYAAARSAHSASQAPSRTDRREPVRSYQPGR